VLPSSGFGRRRKEREEERGRKGGRVRERERTGNRGGREGRRKRVGGREGEREREMLILERVQRVLPVSGVGLHSRWRVQHMKNQR